MMLTVGNCRSYSDVCQLTGGERNIWAGYHLDGSLETGIFRCGNAWTVGEIIKRTAQFGWYLPVVPGTQYATIGGCVANDVHGKNHQAKGSFGNHVIGVDVNHERYCSGDPMFHATIGGLGLTGKITSVDVQFTRDRMFWPFCFPLDYIPGYWWAYKKLGLVQFHCVVPPSYRHIVMRWVKQAPLLLVEKTFGDIPSVGMLSFCRPGLSICMDFVNWEASTKQMFADLEEAVMDVGGAMYPAKTSMSKKMFRYSFPRWQEFAKYVNPEYSSDFWERVK